MLQHIALEVKENDVQGFYTDILGGKVSHQFTMNSGKAKEIFHVAEKIEVSTVNLNNLELELFVHDSIEMTNAKEVFNKANAKGYWTQTHNSSENVTYFIRDKNRNMFEIKLKGDSYE